MHFAAIDPAGHLRAVTDDVDAAVRAVDHGQVLVEDLDDSFPAELNPPPGRMTAAAVASIGLSPIPESAASMSLPEAHRRLWPFFQHLSRRGGVAPEIYASPGGMARAWVGQNFKTSKEHPGEPSKVMGLSLVPHYMLLNLAAQWLAEGSPMAQMLPDVPATFTFCKGSNELCRSSCLVYAGNNAAEVYNTHRKGAQALALLSEPSAFLRMLIEALERHVRTSEAEGFRPYMRLNALSDIPWEALCPWLFARFEHTSLEFYDYTKVAGRKVPASYDLTFSFSGTNERLAKDEIGRKRRVAVVFLAHKRAGERWVAWKRAAGGYLDIPLPKRFWGLPVVDGDVSDVRPLDPAPSIVALRWKSPSGKRSGITVDPSAPEFSFVVPVFVVDAEAGLADPFARPNPAREQWLVSAVTPRHQPMTHAVAQPGLP